MSSRQLAVADNEQYKIMSSRQLAVADNNQ